MNNVPNNDSTKRRPQISKSSSLGSKKNLVYAVINGDVVEFIDGRRYKLSETPSITDKIKSKKTLSEE